LEVEEKLTKNPNIIEIYRLPNSSTTHAILYGFQDLSELDEFFHSSKTKKAIHRFIEPVQIFSFSHNSLIKKSPLELFHKTIEGFETYSKKPKIQELEEYKKKFKNK
jgi:hypothetical protein